MNILITNDDGIRSPFIPPLAKWASKIGNVTVAAPKVEQSGKSQSINFTHEVEAVEIEIVPGLFGYSIDSTPADCVRFGTRALGREFDFILSGINRGYNLGDDIVYSGTCGAIFEGARMGIPGLAVSTDVANPHIPEESLDLMWRFIKENDLYAHNPLYNVNIPENPQGIRITKQGGMYYTDSFVHRGGIMYVQSGEIKKDSGTDPTTDINTVRAGMISVTPLVATRTEMSVFEKLKNI
ncbi:MAG: 5'/3'-nucleotidase SurE [Clostridia bacterium]|nr:5'/3'-nucleotidase SurE [Clostridia bacterium]